ncbi:hypothetical protein Bbelb_050870 [Branchiostoma belcheri]|nr:hypothetical protein Bbelb_050870 [Branchiostoma belcheri]
MAFDKENETTFNTERDKAPMCPELCPVRHDLGRSPRVPECRSRHGLGHTIAAVESQVLCQRQLVSLAMVMYPGCEGEVPMKSKLDASLEAFANVFTLFSSITYACPRSLSRRQYACYERSAGDRGRIEDGILSLHIPVAIQNALRGYFDDVRMMVSGYKVYIHMQVPIYPTLNLRAVRPCNVDFYWPFTNAVLHDLETETSFDVVEPTECTCGTIVVSGLGPLPKESQSISLLDAYNAFNDSWPPSMEFHCVVTSFVRVRTENLTVRYSIHVYDSRPSEMAHLMELYRRAMLVGTTILTSELRGPFEERLQYRRHRKNTGDPLADGMTKQALEVTLANMIVVFERRFHQQLNGKYQEGQTMFKMNKTGEWLDDSSNTHPDNLYAAILTTARKQKRTLQNMYHERHKSIDETKKAAMQQRAEEAKEQERKKAPKETNICETTLRHDMVLWSSSLKTVVIVELTVPWEDNIELAFERKKLKYQDLVQQCRERG